MNGLTTWLQLVLAMVTLIVVGLIIPLIKQISAARSREIQGVLESIERVATKLDRHLDWHLGDVGLRGPEGPRGLTGDRG